MQKLILLLSIFCSLNVLAQTPSIAFRSHSGLNAGFFKLEMTDNLGLPSNYSQRQFENVQPVFVNDTNKIHSAKTDSVELKKQEELQKKLKAEDVKVNQTPLNISGGPSENKKDSKKSKKRKLKKSTSSSTKMLNHTTLHHQKDLKQNGFSVGVITAGFFLLLMALLIRKTKYTNEKPQF